MKNILLTVLFGTLLVGYTNLDFHTVQQRDLATVNEASRVFQAKELLGKAYRGSLAQKLEGNSNLNESIHSHIKSKLNGKWKLQSRKIAQTLISESGKKGFDPVFVMAVIQTESKFNPLTRGSHGEIGLMQIKPKTAKWIAHKNHITWYGPKTLENPSANIRIGMAYMSYLRDKFQGKSNRYVTAYNMGPLNVKRLFAQQVLPKEYSTKVMHNYKEFYKSLAANNSATLIADSRL